MSEIVIQKIPSLTCKKCGSTHVMMTNDGPECDDCDAKPQSLLEMSEEIEYFIHQLNSEEN